MKRMCWAPALLAAACGSGAGDGEQAGGPAAVEVAPAERRQVDRAIDAVGLIEARESVWVSSGISGIVRSVHFEEGEYLRFVPGKSPVLFQLDTSILGIEVEGARREAASVGAELAEARTRFARVKMLYEGKAASRAEFDEARYALARIMAERSRAQTGVKAEKQRAGQAAIRAPFPGLVTERAVSPGQYVQPGQRLVEILDVDAVKVAFAVSSTYLPDLQVGMPVTVTVPALREAAPRQAKVTYVSPRVEESGTVHLHVELANPERRLRPGLPAKIRLILAAGVDSVVIPEEAVEHRGDKVFVYVVYRQQARRREIRIDRRLSGEVVVASGLTGGESVITRGLERVTDGTAVKPIARQPAAPATAPAPAAPPAEGKGEEGQPRRSP